MKIYDCASSPNSRKVRALAYELDLAPSYVSLNVFRGEHKRSPELAAMNPNGKLPVLAHEGLVLWESNAILNYLAALRPERDLTPTAPRRRAEVERWLFWQTAHLGPAVTKVAVERFMKKLTGRGAPDPAAVDAGVAEFAVYSAVLDKALEGREYVAGALSVADFALWGYYALRGVAGLEVSAYPHLGAWLTRIEERSSVKAAVADAQRLIEQTRAAAPPS